MRARLPALAGLAIIALAALPPLSGWLETRLTSHVLGQYLALILGGALIGHAAGRQAPAAGWSAAPAIIAAAFATLFWLLPRWIDAALGSQAVEIAKLATLAGAGLALGWGWAQAGAVLRGFTVANGAAMLAVMGWLQIAVPQRLCNSYLVDDQRMLGAGMLWLAGGLLAGFAMRAARVTTRPRAGQEAAAGPRGR